jgi:acetyl esterase/lipase
VSEQPEYLRPFLLDPPEAERERAGRVDLYLPGSGGPRPAIVFVHGGPVPAQARPTPRDWPAYAGYGRYAASQGAVGVTVDHRLHGLGDYPRAAEDVAAAVEVARADPQVDAQRVALWFFSGGGLLSAGWLAAPPAWLRCVAATYPLLAPLPDWRDVDAAAGESGAAVEVIDVPGAHHGFETVDHTEPARQAVRSAVRSVLAHLRAG